MFPTLLLVICHNWRIFRKSQRNEIESFRPKRLWSSVEIPSQSIPTLLNYTRKKDDEKRSRLINYHLSQKRSSQLLIRISSHGDSFQGSPNHHLGNDFIIIRFFLRRSIILNPPPLRPSSLSSRRAFYLNLPNVEGKGKARTANCWGLFYMTARVSSHLHINGICWVISSHLHREKFFSCSYQFHFIVYWLSAFSAVKCLSVALRILHSKVAINCRSRDTIMTKLMP